MTILPRFYVYVLARPNDKVFYVGKGTGNRATSHDYEARNGCACHKCKVIRKIWRQGGDIQRYIVFTADSEQDAHNYEIELIAFYGRENLTNRTDGGEGMSGYAPSKETRAKVSASVKSTKGTPEAREHARAQTKARWENPEYRAQMAARSQARWNDPEWKAKQVARLRLQNAKPERRNKISTSMQGHTTSEETRAKISARHTGRKGTRLGQQNTPEHRQKISAALRARSKNRQILE